MHVVVRQLGGQYKLDGKGLLVSIERSTHRKEPFSIKQSQTSSLSVLEGHIVQELPIFTKNTIIIVRISIKKKLESYFFFNCLFFQDLQFKKIS